MNPSRLFLIVLSLAFLSVTACEVNKSGNPSGPSGTPTPPAAQPTAAVTASATGGVQAGSSIGFTVQTENFQPGGLNYNWDFGDGETSSDQAPSHIFFKDGTHTVAVTVSNGQQSARAEVSVDIFGLSGNWLSSGGTTTMRFTQTRNVVVGEASVTSGGGEAPYTGCLVTGSVTGPPALIVLKQPACAHPRLAPLIPFDYRLGMGVGGQILSGTRTSLTGMVAPINLNRQP